LSKQDLIVHHASLETVAVDSSQQDIIYCMMWGFLSAAQKTAFRCDNTNVIAIQQERHGVQLNSCVLCGGKLR